jgi:hypothetical protein
MTKTILLARPHPFIVTEMKPFLEQGGFSAKKLANLTELPSKVAGLSGAIISLAVESSVSETVEEVFAELRRVSPTVPVLFAATLSLGAMNGVLRRLAKSNGIEATILGIDLASKDHPDLGKQNTFLYLSNADLATPEKRALVAKIIRRHFH